MKTQNKKDALIILDGMGINSAKSGNAVKHANMPNFNEIKRKHLYTELFASGEHVGLLPGKMGNSEVGHLNIGAGRIVKQESKIISDSIITSDFYQNENLLELFDNKKKIVHVLFMLSDSGVHSLLDHLYAIIQMSKYHEKKIYLHIITDGRDSGTKQSLNFLDQIEEIINKNNIILASVSGRYYAMDREKNWVRTKAYYDMLVFAKNHSDQSIKDNLSIKEYIKHCHSHGETDEFIKPFIVDKKYKINNEENILFLNFRSDRMRQIASVFNGDQKYFDIKYKADLNPALYSITEYSKDFKNITPIFKTDFLKNTLSEILSKNGFNQLKVTETTKYAHLTYFFNGRVEKPFKNEERLLIESKKVDTFDKTPEMRAKEIYFNIRKKTNYKNYDFVLVNFSNPDMLGHTGNFKATIKSLEIMDNYLGKMIKHLKRLGYRIIVTSDHGNCEKMINSDGSENTSHTLNKVPFILIDEHFNKNAKLKKNGKLGDIAATVLSMKDIKLPEEVSGDNLLETLID